jgi:diguanylate cyclase (GGDEF)-like protein/PAS domain S-box-containing protein
MANPLATWLKKNEPTWGIVDQIYEGAYVSDGELCIVYWNKSAAEITGHTDENVVGVTTADKLLSPLDEDGATLARAKYPLSLTLNDGLVRTADLFLRHADGHRVPVTARTVPVRDRRGKIMGGAEIFRDNTAKVAALEKIEALKKIAWTDALTQIGNRRYTENWLEANLAKQEHSGNPFGMVFIDVDHFKKFNDNYGHDVGDQVLMMVARTLAHNLKPTDFVGRWGGEEFVVLLSDVDSVQLLADAEKLRRLIMHSTLSSATGPLHVTASMGATLSIKGDTVEKIAQRADKLLYRSKAAGRNRVTIKVERRARQIIPL